MLSECSFPPAPCRLAAIGHTQAMFSRALPDSASVLTASHVNTAKLGSVEAGEGKLTVEGHTQVAISATLSPDSTMVHTATHVNTAKLGSVRPARESRQKKATHW